MKRHTKRGPNMRSRTIVMAALLLSCASGARAQQDAQPQGSVDIGYRGTDLTGDKARFERFRDLPDGGFVERFRFDREGINWIFNSAADHVGRRDQRYFAEFRSGGKVKASFEWNQIPLFNSSSTRTPYSVESPGVLTLPDSLQAGIQAGTQTLANAAALATPFNIRSRRDVAAFSLVIMPTKTVDVKFDLKTTRRKGDQPFNGSFGMSNAIELVAPIDTRTTDLNTGIVWKGTKGLLNVGYVGQWFTNNVTELVWDSPWRLTTEPARGRQAIWPSNSTQGVTANGAIALPARSRFSGNVTIGGLTQNEPLIPFTINPTGGVTPLPRNTAEGEVRTVAMNYRFTSRPNEFVYLNARYRFYDYDNRTPPFTATGRRSFDASTIGSAATSPIFSSKTGSVDLEASLTPIPLTAIRLAYGRTHVERTERIFETTTENVVRASVDTSNGGVFMARVSVERSARTGEHFESETLEHAAEHVEMRHFDVADRDRTRVNGLVQVNPIPAFGISASVGTGKDDYKNSVFGLRNSDSRSYSLSLDLTPVEQVVAGVSYGYDKFTASQLSRSATAASVDGGVQFNDPARNWTDDSADKVHTVAANLDMLKLVPKTELRFGYVYTKSNATYVYTLAANSPLTPPVQLPAVINEQRTGTIDFRYFLTSRAAIGFAYWYDQYKVSDFALGTDTINRLDQTGALLLGYVYEPYKANTVWVRLTYFW